MRVVTLGLLILTAGCWPIKSQGHFSSTTNYYDESGNITKTEETESTGSFQVPKNVEEVSGWGVGNDGINFGGFSTWEIDHVLEQAGIFYYGAIGLVILAALAVWWKQYILAIALAGGAALLGFAPSLIDQLRGFIIPIVLILIIGGLFYVFGKYVMGWDMRKKARRSFSKLMGEGKKDEAVAALRAGDPDVDKEYRNGKKKTKH